MADFAHYRCPVEGCGEEIESKVVNDPAFGVQMDAHIAKHRVLDYISEGSEVWPDEGPPTPEQIRDALDTAAQPITLAQVKEALGKLTTPAEITPTERAIQDCKEMIEQGIADVLAIQAGGSARQPSFNGAEYDLAYAQGRKDTARVILLTLTGAEHITSDDVKTERPT